MLKTKGCAKRNPESTKKAPTCCKATETCGLDDRITSNYLKSEEMEMHQFVS